MTSFSGISITIGTGQRSISSIENEKFDILISVKGNMRRVKPSYNICYQSDNLHLQYRPEPWVYQPIQESYLHRHSHQRPISVLIVEPICSDQTLHSQLMSGLLADNGVYRQSPSHLLVLVLSDTTSQLEMSISFSVAAGRYLWGWMGRQRISDQMSKIASSQSIAIVCITSCMPLHFSKTLFSNSSSLLVSAHMPSLLAPRRLPWRWNSLVFLEFSSIYHLSSQLCTRYSSL